MLQAIKNWIAQQLGIVSPSKLFYTDGCHIVGCDRASYICGIHITSGWLVTVCQKHKKWIIGK